MKRSTRISSCVVLLVVAITSWAQQGPRKGKQYDTWLAQAKSHYAKLALKSVTASKLTGPAQQCVAEINAASPVDVACTLPAGAKYFVDLQAKTGGDNETGFNWKSCDAIAPYLCHGVDVSWYGLGELPEENGRFAVQIRLVPFYAAGFRGRLAVSYQLP